MNGGGTQLCALPYDVFAGGLFWWSRIGMRGLVVAYLVCFGPLVWY